jgi:hypothetical protein
MLVSVGIATNILKIFWESTLQRRRSPGPL